MLFAFYQKHTKTMKPSNKTTYYTDPILYEEGFF